MGTRNLTKRTYVVTASPRKCRIPSLCWLKYPLDLLGKSSKWASGLNTHRSFHDRCTLSAYGATLMVPLITIAVLRFFERNLATVGGVFDIRALDHVPVFCEQGATHSELGIGAV
jgi:hypothetical protein